MSKIIVVLMCVTNFLFSQSENIDFIEISVNISDSSFLNKKYDIEGYTTAYLTFFDDDFEFSPLNSENINKRNEFEQKVLNNVYFKDIDTLILWGTVGVFNCYEFIQNSINNVKNLMIFHYGKINVLNNGELENDSIRHNFKELILESSGMDLDLELINENLSIKKLQINNSRNQNAKNKYKSKKNFTLKNRTKHVDTVWINIFKQSELKWWFHRRRFKNSVFLRNRKFDLTFRRESSLNRINLEKENNWKKL